MHRMNEKKPFEFVEVRGIEKGPSADRYAATEKLSAQEFLLFYRGTECAVRFRFSRCEQIGV